MRAQALAAGPLGKEALELFKFLQTVKNNKGLNVVLRVSGGWVRDHFLQIPSSDIDITIETNDSSPSSGYLSFNSREHGEDDLPIAGSEKVNVITGETFTRFINDYQTKTSNHSDRYLTNPVKSKQLETAQMNLFGFSLDFCHLRKDEYSAESRIPVVSTGTPYDDAMRRDFTVNALFYNLETENFEDFTEQGVNDLNNRILRTPKDTKTTLLEDPLRLLRGIRLAGQLGFQLDEELIKCAIGEKEVLSTLRVKLSRERIGVEVAKMFSGKDPGYCIKLLINSNLLYNSLLWEVHYGEGGARSKNQAPEVVWNSSLLPLDDERRELGILNKEKLYLNKALKEWSDVLLRSVLDFCEQLPQQGELKEKCKLTSDFDGLKRIDFSFTSVMIPLFLNRLTYDCNVNKTDISSVIRKFYMEKISADAVISSLVGGRLCIHDNGFVISLSEKVKKKVSITINSRVRAVIVNGLKQYAQVGDNVARMVDAVNVLLPKSHSILLDVLQYMKNHYLDVTPHSWDGKRNNNNLQKTDIYFTNPEVRGAIFNALLLLNTPTMCPQSALMVLAAVVFSELQHILVNKYSIHIHSHQHDILAWHTKMIQFDISNTAFTGNTDNEFIHSVLLSVMEMMQNDTNGRLLNAWKFNLPVPGSELLKQITGMKKQKLSQYLREERKYFILHPKASNEECVEYLRGMKQN